MILKLLNERAGIRRVLILLLGIIFFIFLYSFNKIDKVQLTNKQGISYEKGKVVEIIEDNLQEDGSRIGYQKVKIKMLSGELKGEVLEGTSFSGYLYGADCKVNMKVIVNISTSNEVSVVSVYSYYRAPIIYVFVGLFLLMLWVIGGKKGLKSVIGLIFTFICIMYLLLPMIYKGYSPFLSAVIVVILVTLVSLYLIDGITKKTISAMVGTVIGVVIAGVFAAGFGYFAKYEHNPVSIK